MDEHSRAYYFQLAAQAARELVASRGQAPASGLKVRLQRLSGGTFSEALLGYRSFRDFLSGAQTAGAIRLYDAGQDLAVVPAETVEPRAPLALTPTLGGVVGSQVAPHAAEPPVTVTRRARRIRPDLWTSFVDWSDRQRMFDRVLGRAEMFTADPMPGEDPRWTELRAGIKDNPERYVPIQPIGRETALGWMHRFAGSLEDKTLRHELLARLAGDHPEHEFTDRLRGTPVIRAWNLWRQDRVAEVIKGWLLHHGLDINIYEDAAPREAKMESTGSSPEAKASAPGATPPQSTDAQGELERLRGVVHAAVDQMSLPDLLRLPIPLELLVRR
jgi:hypothetical protein